MKNAGNHGAVFANTGFLLHDGGQNQCLLARVQRRVGGTLAPGLVQLVIHGLFGSGQDLEVRGVLAKGVGVRVKMTLRRGPLSSKSSHDLFIAQQNTVVFERLRFVQGRSELTKGPAFNQGDGFERFIAAGDFL